MPLNIITIPCLSDNYAFLLEDTATGTIGLVDAPEAAPIIAALDERGWTLSTILLTHHHPDHIDGVPELVAKYGCTVVGAEADAHRLPKLDTAVKEGDSVTVGNCTGAVLEVYGHTVGHIAFHFAEDETVFSADSLMAMGCGRLFEGDGPMMWASMQKFLAMPDSTTVCSGHEYTASNTKYALSVEPENAALVARAAEIEAARAKGEFTVPSNLGVEKATNPFLRAHLPETQAAIGMDGADAAAVFTEIRHRKDNF
ncbi:MAG: hydroxyacylglutathione hydrolase [Pseudomonadota bacterium]